MEINVRITELGEAIDCLGGTDHLTEAGDVRVDIHMEGHTATLTLSPQTADAFAHALSTNAAAGRLAKA